MRRLIFWNIFKISGKMKLWNKYIEKPIHNCVLCLSSVTAISTFQHNIIKFWLQWWPVMKFNLQMVSIKWIDWMHNQLNTMTIDHNQTSESKQSNRTEICRNIPFTQSFDCVQLRSIDSAFDWFDWHRLVKITYLLILSGKGCFNGGPLPSLY